MTENSEGHILSLLASADTRDRGFTLLMDSYKERIYWHVRRLVVSHEDAEDILQETFINAFRYAGSFKSESKLFTWLYRIATNESIRILQRKKRNNGRTEQLNEKMIREVIISDPVDGKEILVKFQQAILQLPEKQRIVFNLRYYDEMDYSEISRIVGTSVGSLKTSYHYASEKVKKYMLNHSI